MDVHSDLESDIMVTDAMPKQAALDIKSQVIKADRTNPRGILL